MYGVMMTHCMPGHTMTWTGGDDTVYARVVITQCMYGDDDTLHARAVMTQYVLGW